MKFPDELFYTKEHEWIDTTDEEEMIVGITDFAQSELGDIVYVDLKPVGTVLKAGEVFGTVEAVKTVSDLFMPVDGEIAHHNEKLSTEAEIVNKDPYKEGWMVKIKPHSGFDDLMSSKSYQAFIDQ